MNFKANHCVPNMFVFSFVFPKIHFSLYDLNLKTSSKQKSGPHDITGEFNQTFREELTPVLLKLFPQKLQSKEHFQTQPMRPTSPWYQNHTKITKKGNYRPISQMNIDTKILNNILTNWIQQYIKRITHHDQVEFIPQMQGFFQYLQINQWYQLA